MANSKRNRKQARSVRLGKRRGSALLVSFAFLSLLSVAASTYIDRATSTYRVSYRQSLEVQTTPLCEAGAQALLRNLWRPFKATQTFVALDGACTGATTAAPMSAVSGSIAGVGNYAAGVISYVNNGTDPYNRTVVVRCVGWIDTNHNGVLDPGEAQKTVDVTATFSLSRSQVFDYTYFVNNYGWMDGFGPNDLVVNGDMRANGNFDFTNGSPTVNGSVYAAQNTSLIPPAQGLINAAPLKMTNSTYASKFGNDPRTRQAYDSAVQGAYGSASYKQSRDFIFDSTASIQDNRIAGAALGDANGIRSWNNTGSTTTTSLLDSTPTQQVVMPDLSDISRYTALSSTYTDTKQFFADGSANPTYGQGAYVQIWNGGTNSYQTITTNGVLNGSAALVGSSSHPIIIHGPVTFTQDALIKGPVSGQGTIYTGRNVHIVGSITYANPPDFRGKDQTTIDYSNEHKDMLALAARGSVIMGDTSQFNNSYPLQYMTPPFTHPRYDDNGVLIPAFDATQVDSTGKKRYQSVLGDAYLHSIASGITEIDAILYTNFVGGGDVGTEGKGVDFNGSIISKDESMVVFSLPMRETYDNRIRERQINQQPLIDLKLPRSPIMLRSSWQDRGFNFTGL